MAIVVTGTPGVGKTTVAQELAKRLGLIYINLAELVISKKLYLYFDDSLKSYVVDVIKCRSYLSEVLSCREVLDTHVLDAIPPEKTRIVIVLRLNPLELKKRLQLRGYSGRKLSENVESEVLGVVLSDAVSIFGENSVCEVDASGKSVEEIVSLLLDVVAAGKPSEKCRAGLVDWLKDYYWLLRREEQF
ncbi:MAG: adenylate kinase family protein [Thermofilum sp.]